MLFFIHLFPPLLPGLPIGSQDSPDLDPKLDFACSAVSNSCLCFVLVCFCYCHLQVFDSVVVANDRDHQVSHTVVPISLNHSTCDDTTLSPLQSVIVNQCAHSVTVTIIAAVAGMPVK